MPSIKLPPENGSAEPAFDTLQSARELRLRTARRDITERRRITQKLRQALATGGFVLHYQPVVSLKTGLARGAETLIRLQHSRRGLIPAPQFMPIAERSDVIVDVAGWMLHTACAEAATWPDGFTVGVALSLRHLQSGKLIRQLLEALSQSGLTPERLELEITEAMLIDDSEDTIFALKALRGLGVRLALNNFGTGYASLSALKRLPVATLRLDRSLTHNLAEGQSGTAIVRAAIEAGHALGCAVLADGVETEAQFRQLCGIGADEGQGPYFSPAVSAAEMAAMFIHT
jgi:EAL domain-containing protein (putative c-di-GMP-specific phosphodiesterase class I)